MKQKYRIYMAWTLLITAIIAWPVTALTVARSEPPFVLSLSWLAIILTALDVLLTAENK